jgi:hypothetical protein
MSLQARLLTTFLGLAGLLLFPVPTRAQLTVSVLKPSSATDPIVFTFNEPMDTTATSAVFFNSANPTAPMEPSSSWNAASTILTCTPVPSWPEGANITWLLQAQSQSGDSLSDPMSGFGMFTVNSGGGTGNGNTNALTVCAAGALDYYNQDSSAAPVLAPDAPYGFTMTASLASNQTASAVSVAVPSNGTKSLSQNPLFSWDFYSVATLTNLDTFNASYPAGSYVFTLTGDSLVPSVTATLPPASQQPNAPHVSNFGALQAVNPAQGFVLTWDAFQGGTATDFISVNISGNDGLVFQAGTPGQTNSLKGTATSVSIPAGTLQAGSTYDLAIGFYRVNAQTNTTSAGFAFRATLTTLTMTTSSGGTTTPPVISGPIRTGNTFSFDVTCSPGQTITLQSSSDLRPNSWTSILVTNSLGSMLQITAPPSSAPSQFYRVSTGP